MDSIIEPTLLLDVHKCRSNIRRMAQKARKSGVQFRPHFKTHQSHEIGEWFREEGVDKITVSSLKMAMYFADSEWTDITVAFPVNVLEIERINQLAARISLQLLCESIESAQFLRENITTEVGIFIKIDNGYHRTGIDPEDEQKIDQLIQLIIEAPLLSFKGFLSHAGHSYAARSYEEIKKVHESSLRITDTLFEKYESTYPGISMSVGDTPTCSVMEDFGKSTEIRPGNFVFYDLAQAQIGSCKKEEIAVAMACPVVAVHPSRNKLIIYGGGVHFSKDQRMHPHNAHPYFGLVVDKGIDHWSIPANPAYISSLSQEHGIISGTQEFIQQHQVGDLLYILPIHSCMTANLMKSYTTMDGKIISRL